MKRINQFAALALVVALPLFLAACDKDNNNNPIDTGVDTFVDTGTDTHVDSVPDPVVDTTPDPVVDTAVDTAPDSTTCTSGTAAAGGICNIIDQCGCTPGTWCTWSISAACALYEDCYAGAAGTTDVEGTCSAAGQCRPGTDCLTTSAGGNCYEWCRTSTDCSMAGRECNIPVSFTLPTPCTGSATPPYLACSQGCPADANCDLWSEGTCGAGNMCMWDPTCDILACMPAGTGAPGAACTDVGCAIGAGCYTTTSVPTATCYQFCDTSGSHTCTTGTCGAVGSISHATIGVCQ